MVVLILVHVAHRLRTDDWPIFGMKKKLPSSLPLAPELLGVPTQLTSGPLTTSLEVATDFVQAVGVLPLPASAIPAAQMPSRYLKRRVLPFVLHSTGPRARL